MILITGARGHIGNTLLRRLSAIVGRESIRLLLRDGGKDGYIEEFASEIVYGDISDYESVASAVSGCEQVYHLAATISLGSKLTDTVYRSNVTGVKNIVNACLAGGVKRLVYTDSVEALVPGKRGCLIKENRITDVQDAKGGYAKSKVLAYNAIKEGMAKGLDTVIVYPSAVIGPNDYRGSYSSKIIKYYSSKSMLKFYFGGAYNFVDVRYVADCLIAAMERGKSGEDYIIAGEMMDIKTISRKIARAAEVRGAFVRVPYILVWILAALTSGVGSLFGRQSAFNTLSLSILKRNCCFDVSKTAEALGVEPAKIDFTLKDTVKWLRDN